jgi:antitoxin (DNA-binding transcriptional repressor) of toxin-antitoxin stability system
MKTAEPALATITLEEFLKEWPEEALALEKELLITRDGKPIAKLVSVPGGPEVVEDTRRRFNAAEHRKWQKEVFGDEILEDSTPQLMRDREDRNLI